MNRRRLLLVAAVLLSSLLQGCYYMQAVHGQFGIWNKSRPLDEVIDDPRTDATLAGRLRIMRDAREFASDTLLLPDNGSYRKYADLDRDYVVWNVIAAAEFSLKPRTWCYLVVGCLAYRGYFDADAAYRYASELQADGYDVYVGGVPAYSTLGRFDDPLLNTMLARDDADLVALLFHELAHQRLYLKDDTAFNESFASAVAEFGLQDWFDARGDSQATEAWLDRQDVLLERMTRIDETRAKLAALYSSDMPELDRRQSKLALFEQLATNLSENSRDPSRWSAASLNNAWLATLTLYRGHLPAFRRLFATCESDWACFYAAVDEIAAKPGPARAEALAKLSDSPG